MSRRIQRAEFDTWADYYAHYQRELARRHLIPFLEQSGVSIDGAAILDVGCGDGGATREFARSAGRCVGLDIGDFPWTGDGEVEFRKADILDESVAASLRGQFDIVLLRDVIEHIPDKEKMVRHLKGALRGSGLLLVTFPPYYSAFGGHQQVELTGSRLRYLPYMHAHPRLRHIARTRMTVGAFERLARRTGLVIRARRLFALRPSFELRYGLPTLGFGLPW
ncbi:MAG: class I SAM-dependent methyltransferase, partial [Candidatus Eisenbacteria bacterium]|nr:class I SAM-dependent methyltransferase [Candidatus Eisenbacteria bacterium]